MPKIREEVLKIETQMGIRRFIKDVVAWPFLQILDLAGISADGLHKAKWNIIT